MPQYLLTVYQPDGGTPDVAAMARIDADLQQLDRDLRATGSWVFSGGLRTSDTAPQVVRGDGLVTDGPYLEAKEHIGGILVVIAPDLAGALEWARRAAAATTLPIEVQAFQDATPR